MKRAAASGNKFDSIDTSTNDLSGKQGERFSLRKALAFLRSYSSLPKVVSARALYITPGQTFFGLLKYAPFMVLALILRKPYVIHVHGNHLGNHFRGLVGVRRSLFQWLVSRAAAGIVLSESLRLNFDGLLSSDRVFVVENFAGDELFRKDDRTKPADKLRILYLSNLMREKGILDLLEALCLLKSRNVQFEVTIAGQMESGIGPEIRQWLDRLGDCVRYIGSVTGHDKLEALEQANIFVLPTYYVMEGQPISLLEGLATGNIIVTTAHAGIPDVIDGSNGYVVPVRNADAITEALSTIAADLSGHIARYSAHNSNYAAMRFTEQAFAERILQVLGLITDPAWNQGHPRTEHA